MGGSLPSEWAIAKQLVKENKSSPLVESVNLSQKNAAHHIRYLELREVVCQHLRMGSPSLHRVRSTSSPWLSKW